MKRFLSISAAVVIIDQAAKLLVEKAVPKNSYIELTEFFRISNVRNTGSVFGILQNNNKLFALLTLAIIVAIIIRYRNLPKDKYAQAGYALLLGGACGNFIDRAFFGGVTDFIDFTFWPAFNIADSALSISIAILLFHYYKK